MKKKYTLGKEAWERECNRLAGELPAEPPDGWRARAAKLSEKDGLFIYRAEHVYVPLTDRREKMVKVHCTCCHEETYLPYVKVDYPYCQRSFCMTDPYGFEEWNSGRTVTSYDEVKCLFCGKTVRAMHVGRFRNGQYCISDAGFVSVTPVRGHICVCSFVVQKYADKEGKISFVSHRNQAMAVVDGRPVRFSAAYNNCGQGVVFTERFRKIVKFEETIGSVERDYLFVAGDPEDGTDSAHSAIGQFCRDAIKDIYPGKYLWLWTKYPQLENLVRQGYARALNGFIDASYHYKNTYSNKSFDIEKFAGCLDLREVRPSKMLGLSVEDFRRLRGASHEEIGFFRDVKREYGVTLSAEQLRDAFLWKPSDWDDVFGRKHQGKLIPIVRMIGYLAKQRDKYRKKDGSSIVTPSYYNDYLEALCEAEPDAGMERCFPKDIVLAHNDEISRVKYLENMEISAKIGARATELADLSFEDPESGLLIRPCETQRELIAEGSALSHCVARYAKDVASGKTSIFFVRHTDAPGIPFYTLEWKDGRIAQDHGYLNELQTPEILAFEKKWLEHVKNVEMKNAEKEKKENGKCTERDGREVACIA